MNYRSMTTEQLRQQIVKDGYEQYKAAYLANPNGEQISDYEEAFSNLVARGDLTAKPDPVHIHSTAELREMSPDQIKAAYEQAIRTGVIADTRDPDEYTRRRW